MEISDVCFGSRDPGFESDWALDRGSGVGFEKLTKKKTLRVV